MWLFFSLKGLIWTRIQIFPDLLRLKEFDAWLWKHTVTFRTQSFSKTKILKWLVVNFPSATRHEYVNAWPPHIHINITYWIIRSTETSGCMYLFVLKLLKLCGCRITQNHDALQKYLISSSRPLIWQHTIHVIRCSIRCKFDFCASSESLSLIIVFQKDEWLHLFFSASSCFVITDCLRQTYKWGLTL